MHLKHGTKRNRTARHSSRLQDVFEKQSKDFKITWSCAGTLYFISQHASLVSYHGWLQQFFGALTDPDRQAMITGLHAARERFPARVK